jgi:hypothetical protein
MVRRSYPPDNSKPIEAKIIVYTPGVEPLESTVLAGSMEDIERTITILLGTFNPEERQSCRVEIRRVEVISISAYQLLE